MGILFGAVAARSEGIYFLMITLALGVMVFYFFAQVTSSGFGVNTPELPSVIGNPGSDPVPLFYVTLGASVLVFFGIRWLVRTPFGLAMQGLRDEPARMRALGFNVTLHRTLAFAAGAFIVGIAGLLGLAQPAHLAGRDRARPDDRRARDRRDRGPLPDRGRLGGAIFFALLDNYSREWTPDIGEFLGPERFNTLIGIIFW